MSLWNKVCLRFSVLLSCVVCRGSRKQRNSCIKKLFELTANSPEPKEKKKLMRSIFKILKELARAPIDEVELLMIILALHKTGDVVKIMWRRTEQGQTVK